MNRQILAVALLLPAALAPLPALGADYDSRLVSREYNPDRVVRIEGKAGVQASIEFAPEEHIENVAVGDSNTWQITPNKRANLLFVKPLNGSARTNMTVVTDRRTYLFDLIASANARPLYLLRFTYPNEPETAAPASSPASAQFGVALTQAEADAATGNLAKPPAGDPAKLNFAWIRKGSARLLPAQVYDDGQSTFLGWESGTPLPAIQIRNERGEEGPVNFAVRDGTIVVEGVPEIIILRSGKHSATLEYKGTVTRPAARATALAAVPPAAERGN